ncbi:MAG: STAS domain-containing protein [Solirubrobacteraceae bacterium]
MDNQDRTAEVLAHPVSIGGRADLAQAVYARPQLALASTPVWRHKLILTGKLDYCTAIELEDEIACLCEEGVTTLTLDLRQLDAIDSVGAQAIALHGAACKGRGRDFAVVPGSPVVHRALAEAGAESLFAGDPGETGILRLARTSDSSPRGMSTEMIKNL